MPVTVTIEVPAGDAPVKVEAVAVEAKVPASVTFEQYSNTLTRMYVEFMEIALGNGWDKPSALARKITLEFPERRGGTMTPAKIGDDLTEDMFTPEGWAAYTDTVNRQYAERLSLFRKRVLQFTSEGYFDLDEANRILAAAGLPEFPAPKGTRYITGAGPRLYFYTDDRDEARVTREFQRKYREFLDANGWHMQDGYTPPAIAQRNEAPVIPADERAPLL